MRKSCGITENVGEPKNSVVNSKLLLKEVLSVKDLTDEALSRGEITVCFDPHSTLALPTSLGNFVCDLAVYLGSFFLQILVKQCLRGHKLVFGVVPHKLKDC